MKTITRRTALAVPVTTKDEPVTKEAIAARLRVAGEALDISWLKIDDQLPRSTTLDHMGYTVEE